MSNATIPQMVQQQVYNQSHTSCLHIYMYFRSRLYTCCCRLFMFYNLTETNDKLGRKSRRYGSLVRLEPLDLEKRIEKYTENNKNQINQTNNINTEEGEEEEEEENDVFEAENRANHLFALLKSRINEPNTLLSSNAADNLLLDFFQEDTNETRDTEKLVKTAEEWVLGRQEEMFLSWEAREKREVYVKEMERREKWGCLKEERECVLEELGNGFFTSLVEELMLELSS